MTDEQEMIDGLSPGIRDLVVALREAGFNTVDSGDGSNHEEGMGCAVPFKMIAMIAPRHKAFDETDRLHDFMERQDVDWVWQVEMSYSPNDGNCILTVIEHDPEVIANMVGGDADMDPDHPDYIPANVRFIVKVQASLFATESEQQLIIYNENRSIMYQCPAADAPEMVEALDPEQPKGFFWTHLDKAGRLQLDPKDTADWQDW